MQSPVSVFVFSEKWEYKCKIMWLKNDGIKCQLGTNAEALLQMSVGQKRIWMTGKTHTQLNIKNNVKILFM